MRFEPIDAQSRATAESARERNDPDELLQVVLAVALHEEDLPWAEQFCASLATHAHFNVRGNAILGLGHLARRFERLDVSVAVPLVARGLADPDSYVRGQAHAAAEDLELYLDLPPIEPSAN